MTDFLFMRLDFADGLNVWGWEMLERWLDCDIMLGKGSFVLFSENFVGMVHTGLNIFIDT